MGNNQKINSLLSISNNPFYIAVVLILAFIICLTDFLTDWLLYLDLRRVKPGLVYGPIDLGIIWALLFFTLLGTFFFAFEIVFYARECWLRRQLRVSTEVLWLVVVWCENLPQIIINGVIAACHEYSISTMQLVKSGTLLTMSMARILATVAQFCHERLQARDGYANPGVDDPQETVKISGKLRRIVRSLLTLGFFLHIIGSIVVFQFTFTEIQQGDLKFRVPTTISVGHLLDKDRFFDSVNVYLDGGVAFKSLYHDPKNCSKKECVNWIKLATIYDVIEAQKHWTVVGLRLYYRSDSIIQFKKLYFNDFTRKHTIQIECYNSTNASTSLFEFANIDCPAFVSEFNGVVEKQLDIHLAYITPSYYQQFGAIKYQAKLVDYLKNTSQPIELPLHYFTERLDTKSSLNSSNFRSPTTLLRSQNSSKDGTVWLPHRIGEDMTSVRNIWRTGFFKCMNTAPEVPFYLSDKDFLIRE